MNRLPCNCAALAFADPKHEHIITGDIGTVQNKKLRKLLYKGTKYKELVSIKFLNCKTEIKK